MASVDECQLTSTRSHPNAVPRNRRTRPQRLTTNPAAVCMYIVEYMGAVQKLAKGLGGWLRIFACIFTWLNGNASCACCASLCHTYSGPSLASPALPSESTSIPSPSPPEGHATEVQPLQCTPAFGVGAVVLARRHLAGVLGPCFNSQLVTHSNSNANASNCDSI